MSTSGSVTIDEVVAALRTSGVASAAGVASGTWSSTSIPRVFIGDVGFMGGRNRGRLPFIEVFIGSQRFQGEHESGGRIETSVICRVHCGGTNQRTAIDLLYAIATASLSALRNLTDYNYTDLGENSIGEAQPSPLGWTMDTTSRLENTYDRTTYEIL